MGYPDSILHKVTRPGRYTGGEWNSITKDWEGTAIKVVLAYPELYEVGMPNLAMHILYDLLNRQSHVLAERAFAPWIDMEAAMRESGIPLLSLESKHMLREFDIIGFSLNYELTFTNVLNMLDLAGIPLFAKEREECHPLVIAGGSCALNPEPMADFIDLFVIGEGEEIILELVEIFLIWKREGGNKQDLLHRLSSLSGIYVPSLYEVSYHADGTIACVVPAKPGVAPTVKRRILEKLPPYPVEPVVPYLEVIHDRGIIEVQRGCTRGCRFCQGGMIYRPQRHHPQQEIVDGVGQLVRNCGYNEVALLSLSTSDYPGIENLVTTLVSNYGHCPLSLSLPSLRIDSFSIKLMDSLRSGKKAALTFAPEAGSERLRNAINKPTTDDEILGSVASALARGWSSFKLYFLIGLPTETEEDIRAIAVLLNKLQGLRGKTQPRFRVTLSTLVPKAHTPYQWVAQDSEEQISLKQDMVKQGLRRSGIHLSWSDPKMSLLETVLSRGDRRLAGVIHRAWQLGCTFDAWAERFDYEKWRLAFDEAGVDPGFYAHRQRDLEELLPWSHIDTGVSITFLRQEYLRTLETEVTPDCAQGKCNACGLEQQCLACRDNEYW